MSQLSTVDSTVWHEAADQWSWLLTIMQDTSTRLNNCLNDIGTNWPDSVGQLAGQRVGDLLNQFNISSDAISSIVTILHTLADAVGTAQTVLQDATFQAQSAGYIVQDDGNVYAGNAPSIDGKILVDLQDMVDQALRSADEADQKAAADLAKLATDVVATNEDQVLTEQNAFSQDAIAMYKAMVPGPGTRPDAVAAWWSSLTPGEQTTLANAVPLSLYNLDGIPDSVKKQLAGPGPMNRMALVQYAEDNYTNTSLDWIPKGTNCTLFTSDALAAAGLPTSADWNGTGPSQAPGDFPAPGYATHSWTGAQNLHNYLTSEAGHEVPASQAKPGDVVFFKSAPGVSVDGDPPGSIYHTAIVTAVLPDGDILYTQHSDGMENLSVNGRIESIQLHEGQGQSVTPVVVQIGS